MPNGIPVFRTPNPAHARNVAGMAKVPDARTGNQRLERGKMPGRTEHTGGKDRHNA